MPLALARCLSVTELSAITGLALVSALTHAGVMSKPRPRQDMGRADAKTRRKSQGGRRRARRTRQALQVFCYALDDERGAANDVGGIRCCCCC